MRYIAKMDSYVYDHNYPITKNFDKKATAIVYIKRALGIYPYVRIKLIKMIGGKAVKTEAWRMVRNKRGNLSIRKVE